MLRVSRPMKQCDRRGLATRVRGHSLALAQPLTKQQVLGSTGARGDEWTTRSLPPYDGLASDAFYVVLMSSPTAFYGRATKPPIFEAARAPCVIGTCA